MQKNKQKESIAITPTPTEMQVKKPEIMVGKDPLNATYTIDGIKTTLKDGKHEEQIPGSVTKIITMV